MTKRTWIAAAFALSALTVWAQAASDFQTVSADRANAAAIHVLFVIRHSL